MTIRSTIALFYVIAAAAVAVASGPGPRALAGEIAVLAVFEAVDQADADTEPRHAQTRIHWELDDLPAYLTEENADLEANPNPVPTKVAQTSAVQ